MYIKLSNADVAEWIMNRSIYCSSGQGMEDLSFTEGGRSTVVEYSFQFLEDFQEECPKFPFHGMKIFNYMNSPTYVGYVYNTFPNTGHVDHLMHLRSPCNYYTVIIWL